MSSILPESLTPSLDKLNLALHFLDVGSHGPFGAFDILAAANCSLFSYALSPPMPTTDKSSSLDWKHVGDFGATSAR